MKKFLKEPLVHFVIMGMALFFIYDFVESDDKDYEIVIDEYDIKELSSKWEDQTKRAPTEAELKGLLDAYIKEEIYYREALALRLDHNDDIIRRRLAAKMKFLTQDIAEQSDPSDEEINAFYIENIAIYAEEDMVSYTHVYFSPDLRGNAFSDSKLEIQNPQPKGDPCPVTVSSESQSYSEVRSNFGKLFADTLFNLSPSDSWQGPIKSGIGFHLVLLTDKSDNQDKPLEAVRAKVIEDIKLQTALSLNENLLNELVKKYHVVLDFDESFSETGQE